MTENRDFLKEMEELRVETDGIRNALVSKTGHFQNLLSDSGFLRKMMGELKAMRKKIKEGKEENEKKLKELKLELKNEFLEKIEEIRVENNEKFEELKKEFVEQNLKIQKKIEEKVDKPKEVPEIHTETAPKIPIREAVIGEWKMVQHENYEGFKKHFKNWTLKMFSENLKFGWLVRKPYLDTLIP